MTNRELLKKYKKDFGVVESRSSRWDNVFTYLNNHGHYNIFNAFLKITLRGKNIELYPDEYRIWQMINFLTMSNISVEEKEDIVDDTLEDDIIRYFIYKDDSYKFHFFNGTPCKFKKLSDVAKGFYYKDKLETQERLHHCHHYSIILSCQIPNKNEVVTALVCPKSTKYQNLHSWVEVTIDNEEYVLDTNTNVMINKEAYYKMLHPTEITRIPQSQIIQDFEKFKDNPIYRKECRLYLLYRDEFVKMLENEMPADKIKEQKQQ